MFANFLASHFPDATKQLSPLAGSRRPYRAGSRIDSYSGRFWPSEIAVRVRKTVPWFAIWTGSDTSRPSQRFSSVGDACTRRPSCLTGIPNFAQR